MFRAQQNAFDDAVGESCGVFEDLASPEAAGRISRRSCGVTLRERWRL